MIPDEIRMFGRNWSFLGRAEEDIGSSGLTDYNEQTIYYDKDLTLSSQLETQLHEVGHVIEWHAGFELDDHVVQQMMAGVFVLFADNPAYFEYFVRSMRSLHKQYRQHIESEDQGK